MLNKHIRNWTSQITILLNQTFFKQRTWRFCRYSSTILKFLKKPLKLSLNYTINKLLYTIGKFFLMLSKYEKASFI